MHSYIYENEVTDMVDAKKAMKDAEKTVDTANNKLDTVNKPDGSQNKSGVATEDGEDRVRSFIDSIKSSEQANLMRTRLQNDPVVKQRLLTSQSDVCRNQCVGYMLGSMYLKSLPLDDEYKNAQNIELRNDFDKYIKDNKGGPLFYVKDAFEKSGGTNLAAKRLLEAADDEVKNFHEMMGIDFKGKSADDIRFNLDDEIKVRLDKVTDEISFDEITNAIRTNVTNTAIAEIERAKKEAEEQQELEDELAKNTEITSESAAEEWMNAHRKPRPKFYQPSLFEAMLIGKTAVMKESASDFDAVFAEAVKDYTKVSFGQSFGFDHYSTRDIQRMANKIANI